MTDRYRGVIQVRERGVMTLPSELRRRLGLDGGDVHLEVVEREDGVIELRPSVVVPVDQAWFWSERWQRMERAADADFDAGRLVEADSLDQLLSALED
jgi:AbrB family looped-hinge helix DNA binding protein